MAKRHGVQWHKKKAWDSYSVLVRRKYADKNGMVKCVTCGCVKHWKSMQAGHFLAGRGNSILFENNNVHPQCYSCNVMNHV